MKKVFLTIAILCLFCVPVYAQWQDNTNDQAQGQAQGQGQGQLQGQAQGQGQGQGQMQGQAAIAAQGQLGIVGQKSTNDQAVNVGGDSNENKTYAVSYPSLSGGEGVSQANAYSIFGGLGLSSTEKYKALITQVQAIEAMQSLTAEEKKELVNKLVAKMMDSNKEKRFLGIFWKTSGRDLSNLLGLLAWDSFWKDAQSPFQKQKVEKPVVTKEVAVEKALDDASVKGNEGYVVKN